MLLVFDIGNTNIVVGVFEGSELLYEFRLRTDRGSTLDEYSATIGALLRDRFSGQYDITRCIISSVVPPVTPVIAGLVKKKFQLEPLIVGSGIKSGIQIKISEPSTLGADRVVNAVAAKEIHGVPVIVVDFGTATSFDFVSADGSYQGGIIAPGLTVALESLVRNTAKLPHIELVWPASIIGKNTVSAMQSGTLVGYVCMVDGLIDEILKEVGDVKKIIATGGLGALISKHSKRITAYEKDLTLQGLRIIADLNS